MSRGAGILVRDQYCVQPNESVLISADNTSDRAVIDALVEAVRDVGARPATVVIPQLPFQGRLADPYVPEILTAAAGASDVWFDLTFPYLAGSQAHDKAMLANRTRYLLIGDLGEAAFERMYASVGLDDLFALQDAVDAFVRERERVTCRMTNPAGTDFTFTLGKTATKKSRRVTKPGTSTIMGSAMFYPEPDSVRGTIVVDAVFHEYYAVPRTPITLEVNGAITRLSGGGSHWHPTDRALRRAGRGEYGRVIHLSYGFHPGARFTG
ncbi:MAG: hypothetical protein ACREML_00025, partial [Vulcanimicrobiaceae bacterium]